MSVSKKLVAAISAAAVAGVAFIATPALAEDGAQSGVTIEAPVETEPTTEAPAPVVEDFVSSEALVAPDTAPTDPATEPSVEPTDPEEGSGVEDERPPKPDDWYWARKQEWTTCGGTATDPGLPIDNSGTIYPEGFYTRFIESITPYVWDDEQNEWVLDEKNNTVRDTGYIRERDLTDQERAEKGCSNPETTTIPSFSLPSEVDDATWEPTLPDGVAIDTDSGWKDGAREITVAPKDGYAFTDGQETSFTVKVKEKPAPVDPVEPTDPVTPVTPVEPSTPATPSQGDGKTTGGSQKPVEESTTSTSSKSDRGVSANTGLEEGGKTPLFAGFGAALVAALGGAAWLRRRS